MAYCTVCNAFQKSFNAYLEAMKHNRCKSRRPLQGGKKELDSHLKALSDLISHANAEISDATS